MEEFHVENNAMSVVRRQRGGGGELLRFAAAGQPDRQRVALAGRPFKGLNGGPQFPFTEAVSFYVDCVSQQEVDRLWEALTADGGSPSQCGWLKDRFGMSWQIIPRALGELLGSPDADGSRRAMEAMLQMTKIDVAALRRAFEGEPVA